MSINRIESHTVLRGAANADDWLSFIADSSAVFADEQFTHLVIDNASIHHAVREEVEVGDHSVSRVQLSGSRCVSVIYLGA